MNEDYNCRQEKRNKVWVEVNEQSSHSEQQQSADQNQSAIGNKLGDLYKARDLYKQFVEELGQLRKTPIRDDVLKYCEAQSKKQKIIQVHYKPQTILKKIQTRIEKMQKTKKIKRNWGEDDIKILLWIMSKYSDWKSYRDIEKDLQQQDWKFIAKLIPGVNAEACMFKWLSLKKITLSCNSWSELESNLLSNIVNERNKKGYKHNSEIHDWKEISQELYKLNLNNDKVYRNAKQCRQHWTCYLSPQLKKGPWQLYEDVRLMKFIQSNNGLKKWSEISKFFEGRTQNALKNRYTLIVQKQRKQPKNKHKSQLDIVNEYLQKCYIEQYTTQKMQDHMIFQESELKKQQVILRNKDKSKEQREQNVKKQEKLCSVKLAQNDKNVELPNINLFPCPNINSTQSKAEGTSQQISEVRQNPITQPNQLLLNKYPERISGDSSTNNNSEGQNRPITPIKVQVFRFKDFEKLGMQNFLKQIQPGIMDAAGRFKKVDQIVSVAEWKPVIKYKN